jgi:hypothetical protein
MDGGPLLPGLRGVIGVTRASPVAPPSSVCVHRLGHSTEFEDVHTVVGGPWIPPASSSHFLRLACRRYDLVMGLSSMRERLSAMFKQKTPLERPAFSEAEAANLFLSALRSPTKLRLFLRHKQYSKQRRLLVLVVACRIWKRHFQRCAICDRISEWISLQPQCSK